MFYSHIEMLDVHPNGCKPENLWAFPSSSRLARLEALGIIESTSSLENALETCNPSNL